MKLLQFCINLALAGQRKATGGWLALMLLVVTTPLTASADNCPECGMYLTSRMQTRVQQGQLWTLYGCWNDHLFWVPPPQRNYHPGQAAPSSNPYICPQCHSGMIWIGSRTTQNYRFVNQYRCIMGHIVERG